MIIDAHQHFWKVSRGDYPWMTPDLQILNRDYDPQDLTPILKEHNIIKTVLVQAAPTIAETEFLLDLYDRNDFIAGVVGWLDLEADDFKDNYKRLKEHKGFMSIRPMLQDLEDDAWILQPKVMKNVEILLEDDFPIDLLVHPRHLPSINILLKQFPNLRAVVDHAAKPIVAQGILEPWKELMEEVSSYENVMCKLSSLITQADWEKWRAEDLVPYVHHVVKVFGADRVMFGSDWPYCLLAGTYNEVLQALRASLPSHLTDDELSGIFGRNAASFYKIDSRL